MFRNAIGGGLIGNVGFEIYVLGVGGDEIGVNRGNGFGGGGGIWVEYETVNFTFAAFVSDALNLLP